MASSGGMREGSLNRSCLALLINGGCTQAVVIHPVNCACVAGVPSTRSVHRGQV